MEQEVYLYFDCTRGCKESGFMLLCKKTLYLRWMEKGGVFVLMCIGVSVFFFLTVCVFLSLLKTIK